MLRPYLAILSLRFRETAQYRAAAWAGVFTQVVFGFIIFMSLEAFAASNPAAAPMSRQALLAYVWLGQAFLALLPWNVDKDVVAMVKTGAVAYELARPIDAYTLWYCRTLGWRLSAATLRCIPLILIVAVAFPLVGLEEYAMPAPPSAAAAAAFVLAMPVAVVLGIALTMLMQVTILWTLQVDGVQRIVPAFIVLLAGVIVPLPMFPDWAQPVLYLLPFRGVVDVPYRAYSGDLPPAEALPAVGLALAWTVALVLLGRAIMARGFRRVVIHGG
jgi:ABC-2 type transport system permease protein